MQLDSRNHRRRAAPRRVEDTARTLDEVEQEFGRAIAKLVDGVTKLGQVPWPTSRRRAPSSRPRRQAESLRKMFLAMVDDIGVVLIKLADRLHNMRTLERAAAATSRRASPSRRWRSTRRSPTGSASGSSSPSWRTWRSATSTRRRYREIARSSIAARAATASAYIERVETELQRRAARGAGHRGRDHRPRQAHLLASTARCSARAPRFDADLRRHRHARHRATSCSDCYGALGVVHAMWHPIPGEFDDYIATPKESMYQSLHTAVVGPEGTPLEIQIRTREMHQIAEYGVAAHWRYKEGSAGPTPASRRRSPGCAS